MKVGDTVWFIAGGALKKGKVDCLHSNTLRVRGIDSLWTWERNVGDVFNSWEEARVAAVKKALGEADSFEGLKQEALGKAESLRALTDPEAPVWDGNTVTYKGVSADMGTYDMGGCRYLKLPGGAILDSHLRRMAAKDHFGRLFRDLVDGGFRGPE